MISQQQANYDSLLATYYSLFTFLTGRCHPLTVICLLRDKLSSPAGVLRVIVEPAPIVDPLATFTGATSCVSEPINTSSSITVRCLFAPS
jgi:hypothetical protein